MKRTTNSLPTALNNPRGEHAIPCYNLRAFHNFHIHLALPIVPLSHDTRPSHGHVFFHGYFPYTFSLIVVKRLYAASYTPLHIRVFFPCSLYSNCASLLLHTLCSICTIQQRVPFHRACIYLISIAESYEMMHFYIVFGMIYRPSC